MFHVWEPLVLCPGGRLFLQRHISGICRLSGVLTESVLLS